MISPCVGLYQSIAAAARRCELLAVPTKPTVAFWRAELSQSLAAGSENQRLANRRARACIDTYAHMCIYRRSYICEYTRADARTYACARIHIRVRKSVHLRVRVYARVRTFIYVYIYACLYTRMRMSIQTNHSRPRISRQIYQRTYVRRYMGARVRIATRTRVCVFVRARRRACVHMCVYI